ncbi:hypothetical protein D3C76_599780 [compost metagenome]
MGVPRQHGYRKLNPSYKGDVQHHLHDGRYPDGGRVKPAMTLPGWRVAPALHAVPENCAWFSCFRRQG